MSPVLQETYKVLHPQVRSILASFNALFPSGMRDRSMRALADEMARRLAVWGTMVKKC